jgi:hypothetical protein
MRRKPDAVTLFLAGREPQTRAVMSGLAGAVIAQETRCSQVGSDRQGNADTGIYAPAGRDISLRRKPDAVKLVLAGR